MCANCKSIKCQCGALAIQYYTDYTVTKEPLLSWELCLYPWKPLFIHLTRARWICFCLAPHSFIWYNGHTDILIKGVALSKSLHGIGQTTWHSVLCYDVLLQLLTNSEKYGWNCRIIDIWLLCKPPLLSETPVTFYLTYASTNYCSACINSKGMGCFSLTV